MDKREGQSSIYHGLRGMRFFPLGRHPRLKAGVLATAFLGTAMLCMSLGRGLPARNGILNFGKVNNGLYRGAEPDAAAVSNLQQLGVRLIIDLRNGREVRVDEAREAAAAGIGYTNIPLNGLSRPKADQIGKILATIESAPGPVFVHCEHGCDRTGTVIACYRISHDHWKADLAQTEADLYGMSDLERGMRSFVAGFEAAPGRETGNN